MRRNITPSDAALEMTELTAGAAIPFMSFLAPIPGLLPCLLLAGVFLIPLIVVGAVLAVPAGLILLLLRVVRRIGQATPDRTSTGSGSVEPSPPGRSAIVRSGAHVHSAG